MLKVQCTGCNAPYEVDPRRIPKGGMKMRCPACDTTFMVTPQGVAPAAPKVPPPPPPAAAAVPPAAPKPPAPSPAKPPAPPADAPLGGLDLDLPSSSLGNYGGGDMFADLPAPKGADRGADLELDLPAPKKPAGERPAPAAAPKFDDFDLPAPKPAAASPQKPGAPKFDDFDLPAPKPAAASPQKPAAPKFEDFDLPAPKPAAAPSKFDDFDLPAPKGPAHDRATVRHPGPGQDLGGAANDRATVPQPLPASPGPPPGKSFGKPASPGGPGGAPKRPAPAAAKPPADALSKDSLAIDPEPFLGSGADPFGGLDDPARGDDLELDLPAPKGAAPQGEEVDLPGRKGHQAQSNFEHDLVDLPASKGARPAPDLDLDLPAVKGPRADDGVDLPGVRDGGADLPALRGGGADLPAPKKKPAGDLASRLRAAGALPDESEPPPKAKPAPGPPKPPPTSKAGLPKDSLDIDSFHAMGGELPSPFDLDDASAPHLQSGASDSNRSSAELSQGLNLPSMATGALEPDEVPAPSKKSEPLSGFLDDLEPPDSRGDAPLDLSLDEPGGLDAPAGGQPDDLFGAPAEADAGPPSLGDPFDLGEPPSPPRGGAHEPLELGGGDGLDLELGGEADLPLDLGGDALHARASGGGDFGNLELMGGEDAATADASGVQLDHTPAPAPSKPRDRGMSLDLDDEPEEAPKRKVPTLAWVGLAVLTFLGVGFGLGQTQYGLFGIYLIERFLPEAGDPRVVAEDIEAAEKRAASDTYVDARKSLRMLSDARMSAGLSHRLLSRSLLHEGLFRLRFGENNASSQRSVAILSRLSERTHDAPSMHLAVAAHLAAKGELDEASDEIAREKDRNDPYLGLVHGELLLKQGKAKKAVEQFEKAKKLGGSARATFGLARAKQQAGDDAGALAAMEQTLKLSPLHAGAHVLRAQRALSEEQLDVAELHLLQAVGYRKVGDKRIRASTQRRAEAWTLLGRLYAKRDHVTRALEAYERALEADSLVMEAMLGSGRALLQLSRPRESLSRYKAALEAKPAAKPTQKGDPVPLVEATVGAARALLRLDDTSKAIRQLKDVPKALQSHPEITLWLGHAYLQDDEIEEAEGYFRKTIENAPHDFAGYLALAQMLFAEKRPEEAARTLEEAREQVDDGADMRRMLGQSELSRNRIAAAQEQFEAALEFEPKNTGALFGLATTQRRQGKLDQAMATLDRVEAIDPQFPALALERGRIHEALGHHDEAVAVYEKALAQREGDIDLQLQLGAALVAAGNLDRAEELLKAVLKVRPTSAEAEHFLGRVVFARKDSAQAVAHFSRAVRLDVTQARYHMYLAWASLESGNFAGALESVEKAIERDHTLGDAHWIKGRIQLRMGMSKDAIESFTLALKLSPGRTEAYADMGDAYEQLRKLRSAVHAYEAAVERDAERGDWWYRLGSLLLDRGKGDEATEALSQAVLLGDRMEHKPGWLADAHRIYADALYDDHSHDRALEHYEMYLELAPPDAMDREDVERRAKRLRR